jgi:hypothetical protein
VTCTRGSAAHLERDRYACALQALLDARRVLEDLRQVAGEQTVIAGAHTSAASASAPRHRRRSSTWLGPRVVEPRPPPTVAMFCPRTPGRATMPPRPPSGRRALRAAARPTGAGMNAAARAERRQGILHHLDVIAWVLNEIDSREGLPTPGPHPLTPAWMDAVRDIGDEYELLELFMALLITSADLIRSSEQVWSRSRSGSYPSPRLVLLLIGERYHAELRALGNTTSPSPVLQRPPGRLRRSHEAARTLHASLLEIWRRP